VMSEKQNNVQDALPNMKSCIELKVNPQSKQYGYVENIGG